MEKIAHESIGSKVDTNYVRDLSKHIVPNPRNE